MDKRNFRDLLQSQWSKEHFVCVGLDPLIDKIPISTHYGVMNAMDIENKLYSFAKAIVDATKDIVCAYKPNSAFYEVYGDKGMRALKRTIDYIRNNVFQVPVILDAKRGDVSFANEQYARAAFDYFQADAITVSPYAGCNTLQPFLKRKDKGIFIICHTSDAGSFEFQEAVINKNDPVYCFVARRVVKQCNSHNNCGLVVGATNPHDIENIREIVGCMPILIPGIGAQGGNVEAVVRAGCDENRSGMIISASRSIIYASNGPDFPEVARNETQKLSNLINSFRNTT
jgi:orotidine-5'-phosphate decarboxylase